jgi:hypothetical protein
MTFIASALQWPVVVVPIGFVGEHLPIGMRLLGRPWSEGQLIRFRFADEQATHHRRAPCHRAAAGLARTPPRLKGSAERLDAARGHYECCPNGGWQCARMDDGDRRLTTEDHQRIGLVPHRDAPSQLWNWLRRRS